MRIKNSGVIVVGTNEIAIHEARTEQGDKFRARVREAARTLAIKLGKSVDIYAPKSAGGYMIDQIEVPE